jgi:phosphoserine phosphatase
MARIMGRRYDLVVFDMDGTLTKLRSSWCWIHENLGVDNEPAYRAYLNGEIDQLEFMRRDIGLWLGVRGDLGITDVYRMFRDMPLVDGIQETVAALRYNGMRSVIVSGGVDLAAKMLAREFGFDDYAADGLGAHPDGRLTGEGILHVDLADKGATVREFMKKYGTFPDRTVSIGNSYTDISMFKVSGLSIAFNATDPWTEEAATHSVRGDNISAVLEHILDE